MNTATLAAIIANNSTAALAFKDSDQEKAKRVIQSLVSIFVESSLGASRKDTDSAKTFLAEQIKTFERDADGVIVMTTK